MSVKRCESNRTVRVVWSGWAIWMLGILTVFASQYSVFDPEINHYLVHNGETNSSASGGETLYYNHMVDAEYYDGKWMVVWNAHTESSEAEGNNLIYYSYNTDSSLENWSTPAVAFSDSTFSSNPVAANYINVMRQWHPNLIAKGSELWCFWMITGGAGGDSYTTWFSRKTSFAAKWNNTQLLFDGDSLLNISGENYHVVPVGQPVDLSDSRVFVPVSLIQYPTNAYHLFAGLIVASNGASYEVSGTVPMTQAQKDDSDDAYEIAVYELEDGHIVMMLRFSEESGDPDPVTVMKYSESFDYGDSWTALKQVGLEMAAAGGSVVTLSNRLVAAYSDHSALIHTNGGVISSGRYGAALFVSRSGDPKSYVPGNCLIGPNYKQIGHPRMDVQNGKLYVVYSQGLESPVQDYGRHIWMTVAQAPDASDYYLLSRGKLSMHPDVWDGAVRFDQEQVVQSTQPISIGSGNLSLGFHITPRGRGALVDARSGGNAFMLKLVYDGNGLFKPELYWAGTTYTSDLTISKGYESYLGVSVWNGDKVRFYVRDGKPGGTDTWQEQSMQSQGTVTLASGLDIQFGMAVEGSTVVPYYGLMRQAWVYDTALSDSQHEDLEDDVEPQAASNNLLITLNTNTLETSAFDLAEIETLADTPYGASIKRIRGQGSAGIEVDAFDLDDGDVVTYEFSYKTSTPAADIVLFTAGDADNPLRVELTSNGMVRARSADGVTNLFTHQENVYSTICVEIMSDHTVLRGNGNIVSVPGAFNARAFLGQGYEEDGLSESQSVLIDVDDMYSQVSDMLAWWKFNSETNDWAGYNDAVKVGGSFSQLRVEGSNSLKVDGLENSYAATPLMLSSTNDFTISLHVLCLDSQTSDGSYWRPIVYAGQDVADRSVGIMMGRAGINDTMVYFMIDDGIWYNVGINDGNWHHLVLVRDGNTRRAYHNGSLLGSGTVTDVVLDLDTLMLGADLDNTTRRWKGRMDDVRVYNRALSSEEIGNL